jgi:hypothetical protein
MRPGAGGDSVIHATQVYPDEVHQLYSDRTADLTVAEAWRSWSPGTGPIIQDPRVVWHRQEGGIGDDGGWVDTRDFPATPAPGVSAALRTVAESPFPLVGPIAMRDRDKYGDSNPWEPHEAVPDFLNLLGPGLAVPLNQPYPPKVSVGHVGATLAATAP